MSIGVTMVDNFYHDFIKHKSDVKFFEKLVGRKITELGNLVDDENHFDLILRSVSQKRIERVGRISQRLLAKYLVMHHCGGIKGLTSADLHYLFKVVGMHFNQKYCQTIFNKTFTDNNEQAARIGLTCYILFPKQYKELNQFTDNDAIKHIKRLLMSQKRTKNIGENIESIIQKLRILKRDPLFERKLYVSK